MKRISLFILTTIFIASCSTSSKLTRKNNFNLLKEEIQQTFYDSAFAHAHWGAKIKSLQTGKVWYELNSEKMFMPASNEKIPTSAAALQKLGPDFRFTTKLQSTGGIVDSVLTGDLIVWSNGDPTIYERLYDSTTAVFNNFADSLKQLGIKQVNGRIIGDDNAFDDNHIGYGWTHGGLKYWYSAKVGALQLNENYVDFYIIPPNSKQDSVKIIPNVHSDYFTVKNNITVTDTGRNDIDLDKEFGTEEFVFSGTVRAGTDTIMNSPTIHNPTGFYVTVLKEVLEKNGIEITGGAVDCDEINEYDSLALHTTDLVKYKSPPNSEILKILMKRSQNLYAETMTRVLGWKYKGKGSFRKGRHLVYQTLNNFSIDTSMIQYMDGSGLSRYNYISPAQIVKILEGMRTSRYWDVWYGIMPVAGIDGTLKYRMRGNAAEGNVHAKTGTISNVRALSGYVTTAAGEDLVFSFLVNGHLLSSKDTERITDSVLKMIAEFQGTIL
jgi:D-alanyl-D-alanine carboxypeptidase/D-alanyl-D-alanine-endopeptidase (penicillin-binding protein 4)